MSRATDSCTTRRQGRAETDRLIRDTKLVLDGFGVEMSISKISHLVHRYQHRVSDWQWDYSFADWIADSVALQTQARRDAVREDLRKRIVYADPTGEVAVRNADRKRA